MAIVVRRQFGLPVFLENLPVFHEKNREYAGSVGNALRMTHHPLLSRSALADRTALPIMAATRSRIRASLCKLNIRLSARRLFVPCFAASRLSAALVIACLSPDPNQMVRTGFGGAFNDPRSRRNSGIEFIN
jgi:hypothetical protein